MQEQLQHLATGHPSPDSTVSKLQVYGIGHVAEDKALNSNDVEIADIEHTPMLDGAVTTNATQSTATGVDLSGAQYQVQTNQASTVKATWLPIGQPNRMTAPDVRRGEQVMIYRFGDADKFYWNTMRNDLAFRRLETVVFAISATPTEGETADQSASYFIEFSSHKKSITLSTSKANGEPYAYTLTLDAGNGKVTLADDIDNTLFLDSTQNQFHIQNADGSIFDMTKKAIQINADDSIQITTKDYTLNASNSITEETTTRKLTASGTNEIDSTTTHNGPLTENGPFQLNGDMTTDAGTGEDPGTGKIQIAGDTELLGNMDVKKNLTAVTIEATESITAPNLQYN